MLTLHVLAHFISLCLSVWCGEHNCAVSSLAMTTHRTALFSMQLSIDSHSSRSLAVTSGVCTVLDSLFEVSKQHPQIHPSYPLAEGRDTSTQHRCLLLKALH